MKSQSVTFSDGFFVIVCPHCSNGLSLDEQQLGQINEQLGGKYPCPQSSCAQEIEFPSPAEAEAIKVAGGGAASESEPVTSSAGSPPAPPPQTNPAAKTTPPPSEAPTARAPLQETAASEPVASPAEAADEEIVVGFGGSSSSTLEREAAGLHRLSVKTILHSDCVKGKEDTFDDEVSKFLSSLEEENLVGVHPVQYTADEKKGSDFGVMILYKTVPKED